MAIMFADRFYQQIGSYRSMWIKGRMRSGKTLLAFALGKEFLRRGISDGVISNIPWNKDMLPLHPWDSCYIDDKGEKVYKLIRGAFIVYDEPWVMLDNRTSLTNDRTYAAFLGKYKIILMLPSAVPIDKRLSYLQCQRQAVIPLPIISTVVKILDSVRLLVADGLNFLANAVPKVAFIAQAITKGMAMVIKPIKWIKEDIWIYSWSVEMGDIADRGRFILTEPSSYYPLYDTGATPIDDGDIGELWQRTILEDNKNDVKLGRWWLSTTEFEELQKNAYLDGYAHAKQQAEITDTERGTASDVRHGYRSDNEESSNQESIIGYAENERGQDTSADRNDYAKIRIVAEPYKERPTPQQEQDSEY